MSEVIAVDKPEGMSCVAMLCLLVKEGYTGGNARSNFIALLIEDKEILGHSKLMSAAELVAGNYAEREVLLSDLVRPTKTVGVYSDLGPQSLVWDGLIKRSKRLEKPAHDCYLSGHEPVDTGGLRSWCRHCDQDFVWESTTCEWRLVR